MANAVNFIDGLDGLAAGVVAIAAGAFALYSRPPVRAQGRLGRRQQQHRPPRGGGGARACASGFLPFNVHPARIFMGDAGALLLGLLMACSTLLVGGGTARGGHGVDRSSSSPRCSIPLVIMGVPILDLAFAVVRRASQRVSPAVADRKGHLHHRLERLGHGQRRSVFILWAWTAILSGLVLCRPSTPTRATPSCRPGWPPWPCCSTRSSTPRPAGPGAGPAPRAAAGGGRPASATRPSGSGGATATRTSRPLCGRLPGRPRARPPSRVRRPPRRRPRFGGIENWD